MRGVSWGGDDQVGGGGGGQWSLPRGGWSGLGRGAVRKGVSVQVKSSACFILIVK